MGGGYLYIGSERACILQFGKVSQNWRLLGKEVVCVSQSTVRQYHVNWVVGMNIL